MATIKVYNILCTFVTLTLDVLSGEVMLSVAMPIHFVTLFQFIFPTIMELNLFESISVYCIHL